MYCKGQLVELQHDAYLLRRAGLGLAAISYDSAGVLSDFAKRKSIAFPLLSDYQSETIRAYGLADRQYKKGMGLDVDRKIVYPDSFGKVPVYGLSYPAVLVLARDARVKWRFVSEGPELRLTGAAILEEAVGGIADEIRTPVASRNIQVTATATNTAVGLGNRIRIAVELKIPKGFHVYSPDVAGGYKGVSWQMDPSDCLEIGQPVYPKPVWKRMESTGENLPVYEDTLRISRALSVKPGYVPSDPSVYKLFCHLCLDPTSHIKASGVLKFQACDEQRCYPPQTVLPQWRFQFLPPDLQRSPDNLKREFDQ
ncbi:MAG TPA: protein-disulfide reductase DsbD domain-containing protein [Bryobacteraceae bacterium]|nr:protein-disulfide reductase DsbD domain-containing protein [Bryobacteraceae bacterium]